MLEFTADHFRELCQDDAVRSEIGTIEARRRRVVRHFWLVIAATLVLLAGTIAFAIQFNLPKIGTFGSILIFGLGLGWSLQPLSDTKDDLKEAVLWTLARRGGLEYVQSGFDPPMLGTAREALFGSVTRWGFSDLFHGTDARGKRHAVYEAVLDRGEGRQIRRVFKGQLYVLQRHKPGEGETAILPDKALFNVFNAPDGMERVKFHAADDEFEWRFQVHSTAPAEVPALVSSALRSCLLDLRSNGKVLTYIGPEDVLVAVEGGNRFEPGSMFRARPGEQRAKLMFDDVCASLAVLRRLRAAID